MCPIKRVRLLSGVIRQQGLSVPSWLHFAMSRPEIGLHISIPKKAGTFDCQLITGRLLKSQWLERLIISHL